MPSVMKKKYSYKRGQFISLAFYYLSVSEIWPDKRGGSGLIQGGTTEKKVLTVMVINSTNINKMICIYFKINLIKSINWIHTATVHM